MQEYTQKLQHNITIWPSNEKNFKVADHKSLTGRLQITDTILCHPDWLISFQKYKFVEI
jgi:hypothetical protein